MRWLDGITNSVMGVRLFVTPTDCSLLGSSVHGILQARILERVAMPSARGPSRPTDGSRVSHNSCIGRQVLYHESHLGNQGKMHTNKQIMSGYTWGKEQDSF